MGQTIKKDAVKTETLGGCKVDHKGQHLPGHPGHLEERDGNEFAMTV